MEIFDEFIIVDEKLIADFKVGRSGGGHSIKSTFCDFTQFATLEIQFHNFIDTTLEIKDIGNISKSEVPLAQIICWKWDEKGAQVIEEAKILNRGCNLVFSSINFSPSIVVRIIQKREKNTENQCPPISSADDDLTVQIGDKKITVSAHWLMRVSPVVRRMLSVEMREKRQRLITLDELGVNIEQFKEFIEAISLRALHKPILPNPKNVLVLLKLADFFQVDWLKWRCEMHLINCVEIPLIDRFLLIEKYGLDNLKGFFLRLNVENLRAFFKSNREKFLSGVSKEFLDEFIFTLAG